MTRGELAENCALTLVAELCTSSHSRNEAAVLALPLHESAICRPSEYQLLRFDANMLIFCTYRISPASPKIFRR